MTGIRRWTALGIALAAIFTVTAGSAIALPHLYVKGKHLRAGKHNVRLLGVNRSGTEYMCMPGGGHNVFDGPSSTASIRTMKTWHINAVRVPLNEDCWLNVNGAEVGGDPYRKAIAAWVQRLMRQHLYVVLDLHVAAPGFDQSRAIIPMADADHAPAFWKSVAHRFRKNHHLAFDLYNEPHDISWGCWRHGCTVPDSTNDGTFQASYQATGMQQLVDAVRATGARQPLLVGGVDWSGNVSGWRSHRPRDRRHQLVVSQHQYGGGLAPCGVGCKRALDHLRKRFPVVIGEFGETDCAHSYIDRFMPWFDRRGISYLGWTWNATSPGGWTCKGGPSLIKNFDGTPTDFGVGLRRHLRKIR